MPANPGVTRFTTRFHDANRNGVQDPGEQGFDFGEVGVYDPGDILYTRVLITNSGDAIATGVTFEDTFTGSTLVAGTLNISPLAMNDAFTAVGNTTLRVGTGNNIGSGPSSFVAGNLLSNDVGSIAGDGTPGFQLTAVTNGVSAQGGTFNIFADGTFNYINQAGDTGTDSFTYTIRDAGIDQTYNTYDDLTSTATVTITLSGEVWYVDSGVGPGGTGTSADPFISIFTLNNANKDGAGDTIYIKSSISSPATGPIVLEADQQLIGQGADLKVSGFTLASAIGGVNSTISSDATNGYTVTVGTNNTIAGLRIVGNGTNTGGITDNQAGSFGTLTLNPTSLNSSSSVASITTTGSAITLSDGAIAGNGYGSTTSTGGTNNVSLTNITGTLALGSGALSGAAGTSFSVSGGSVNTTYAGDITQTAASQNLISVTGTHSGSLAFTGTKTSTGGAGLRFSDADGTYNVTGTTNINGGTAGIAITNGSAGSFTFSGTAFNIGQTTSIGGVAVNIADSTASVNFDADVRQTNNFATLAVTNHSVGTLTFQTTASLNATNGNGLQFNNADGTYNMNSANTLNGGDAAIDIFNGSGGSFTFLSNTAITNPTQEGFYLDGSTASVSFGGSITDNSGRVVYINGHDTTNNITFTTTSSITATAGSSGIFIQESNTGGTIAFNGQVQLTTATQNAVTLSNNAGKTITFAADDLGLDITTTTGRGFDSNNGGTINITDVGNGNTITSAGGIAFNATGGTTFGASGVTFDSISANGGASGIVLNGTGAGGAFTVLGDSSQTAGLYDRDGSGGTIQNTSGDAISLFNAIGVTIRQMNITNAGQDGVDSRGGGNILLQAVDINNPGNLNPAAGLNATGYGSGNGWYASSISGTNAFDNNSRVTNWQSSQSNGVVINNDNVSFTSFTVANALFVDSETGAAGFHANLNGNTAGRVVVRNSEFTDIDQNAAQILHNGSGAVTAIVQGNNFHDADDFGTDGNNTLFLALAGSGDLNFMIGGAGAGEGNTFTNLARLGSTAGIIQVNAAGGVASFGAQITGTIQNNTITNPGFVSGRRGIVINAEASAGDHGGHTVAILNNSVQNLQGIGIYASLTSVGGNDLLNNNFTISNNQVGNIAAVGQAGGDSGSAIEFETGIDVDGAGGQISANLLFQGNTATSNNTSGIGDTLEITNRSGVSTGAGNSSTLNVTVLGNNLTQLNAGGDVFAISNSVMSTTTTNVDLNSDNVAGNRNTFTGGDADGVLLRNDAGILRIENLTGGAEAFVEARNNGNFTVTGVAPVTTGAVPMPTQPPVFSAAVAPPVTEPQGVDTLAAQLHTAEFQAAGQPNSPRFILSQDAFVGISTDYAQPASGTQVFKHYNGFAAINAPLIAGSWAGDDGRSAAHQPSLEEIAERQPHVAPTPAAPSAPGDDGTPPTGPIVVDDGVLSQAELNLIVEAAIGRWAAAGATADQIAAMRATAISVADLSGLSLGQSGAGTIKLDANAGGWNWFIDTTPGDDGEFAGSGGKLAATDANGLSGTRIDLLTVVMHELGHQIGLGDIAGAASADDLMYGTIRAGERRLPGADELAHAGGAPVAGAFAIAPITLGNLPAGSTIVVEFRHTIDSPVEDGLVGAWRGQSIVDSNETAPVNSNLETGNIDGLSLGNLIFLDVNKDGDFDAGTDSGIAGVTLTLYADTNNDGNYDDGVDLYIGYNELGGGAGYQQGIDTPAAAGTGTALTTTTDANGAYSFSALAPGDYIVRVDAANFTGALASRAVSPTVAGPNNNVDNDNNAETVGGFTTTRAIRLDYGLETTAGPTGPALDTNNTLDLGFIAPNQEENITGLQGDSVTFTEGGSPVQIDQGGNATIVVGDSPNYDTGSLRVQISGGAPRSSFAEQLVFLSSADITTDMGVVSYQGTAIGTYSITFADQFDFSFNANATPAAVQALIRSIGYNNGNTANPIEGTRTITWTLVDGDGTVGGGDDTTVRTSSVTVVAVNDEPQGTDATFAFNEDGSRILSQADFGFSDSAESNGFAGVVITTTPTNGVLLLNGVPITVAGTFVTAAQISGNQLVFASDANENGTPYATFTFQVRDDGGVLNGGQDTDQSANTLTFNVTAVNDAPVNTLGGTVVINEDATNAPLTGMSISDPDANPATDEIYVTFQVTDGVINLRTDVVGGIAAGDIIAIAVDTVTVQTTLNKINTTLAVSNGLTYSPTANFNGNATLTVYTNDAGYTGSDPGLTGDATSEEDEDTRTITVNSVNDAPAGTDKTVVASEDDPYVFTAADFGFSDTPENNGFAGVVLTTLPLEGDLRLNGVNITVDGTFVSQADIAAGLLTFLADPDESGDDYASFTFQVRDDGGILNGGVDTDQSANTITIDVAPDNIAPVLDLNGAAAGNDSIATVTEQSGPATLAPDLTITDPDDTNVEGATVTISAGLQSADLLSVAGVPNGTSGTISWTYTAATGTLAFTGSASLADYQALLRQVAIETNGDDVGTSRTVTWSVTDGDAASNAPTTAVTVTPLNDPPALNAVGNTPTFTEGDAPVDLFSSVNAVNAEAGQTFTSLTLTVSNVTDGASEVLGFDGSTVALTNGNSVTTATNGLTVTVSVTGSTATVTFSGATLNKAQLDTLVDAITYANSSQNPTDADRVVTITQIVDSGANGGNDVNSSNPNVVATVNVNPINDAPINTVPGSQTINEDASVTFSTGNGNAISVADLDATTLTVTLSVAHGTLTIASTLGLTFSGGSDGTADASMTLSGTAAAINAALGSGLTYNPNANFNGSDSISVFTTDNGQSGGAAQTDSDSIAINITAINDAPVVIGDGTESATTINEDSTGAGQTIQALFAGQYSDAADNQIPNGGASSPGQFSGIAVTANGSSAATGQWQYFSGGVWTDIGAVSDSAAKLLGDPFVTLIRFVPAPDFNGPAPTLTVHLIDNSLPFGIVNGQVVDISGPGATGGTTAYSTGTVVLSQDVTAVNDGPLNTVPGSQTINEDGSFTLSTGNGNAIQVADADATTLTVTLAVQHGTLTLASTTGLTFSGGSDGSGDPAMTFSGTAAAINAALGSGLTYNPTANYNGPDSITVNTSDELGADTTSFASLSVPSLASVDVGARSTPTFADYDGDGDQDLIVGNDLPGRISIVQRQADGSFIAQTGTNNPFNGINFGNLTAAAFADFTGDGKLDALIARDNGPYRAFQGNGAGGYTELTGAANPFAAIGGDFDATPAFTDLDGDGDQDLVVGRFGGDFRAFQNIGNVFTELTGAANPFNGLSAGGNHSKPAFVDIDRDGDLDLVSGRQDGRFAAFQNNGVGRAFTALTGAANPLNAVDAGNFSAPAFGDLNGDGLLDLVSGESNGTLVLRRNVAGNEVAITVNSVNDAPQGTDKTLTGSEDDPIVLTAADFGFSDPIDGNAFLAVIIDSFPANGTLFLDFDGAGGNPPIDLSTLGPGVFVSVTDINLGRLYFQPDADEFGNGYAQFTFRVQDDGGMLNGGIDRDPVANTITINVTPDNLPPVVDLNGADAGIDASVSYAEDGAGVSIGSGITVSDPNEGIGDLIESATIILTDRVAGDVLTLTGTLPPGFVSATTGNAGSITITITGAGTGAQYQALIQSILYSTTNQDPTVGGTDPARTITVTVNDGLVTSAVATSTITITPQDDAPVAQPDAFTTNEATAIVGASVFPNNGSGPDSDPDGPPLSVSAVNGSPAAVGQQIVLASGALLTLRANGTFDYNPNGAFDYLPPASSGASNSVGTDVFSYTLAGGNTVNVTITINGLIGGDNLLIGTPANDTLTGGPGNDSIYGLGADDVLFGGAGRDLLDGGDGRDFLYGGTGGDSLAGGTGDDVLFGEAGEDRLAGDDGDDYLDGGDGRDLLDGGAGRDYLRGGSGNDDLAGGAGADFLFGQDGEDELRGEDGDDYLDGGAGRDYLFGGAGNDSLFGGADSNILFGDSGDDYLNGGDGDDYLDGGSERDLMLGGGGRDDLHGGDGGDTLLGGAGGDLLFGDAGEDELNGDEGEDYLDGGAERDVLRGGAGADYLLGGDGADSLLGGAEGDFLFGGAGEDELRGEDGNDYLDGGDGRGYLFGGNGADTLFGGTGSDVLFGESGADLLNGGEGDDYLDGGAERDALVGAGGRDYLVGGADDDALLGGADGDLLFGGDGSDDLQGDAGDDYIDGGAGDDLVIGGAGADTMLGGAGADVFVLLEAGDSGMNARDSIIDFDRSQGDLIDLSLIDANSGSEGNQAFSFVGTAAFSNTAGELRYEVINGVTNVFADTNGDGVADLSFTVNLPDLQSADLVL